MKMIYMRVGYLADLLRGAALSAGALLSQFAAPPITSVAMTTTVAGVGLTASAVEAQTLSNLWDGTASFVVDNNIYPGTNGMHFIQVVPIGQEYRVFGNMQTSTGLGIGVWRSTNLTTFDFLGVAVQPGAFPWTNGFAAFPHAYRDGTTWYLVFEAAGTANPGSIGLATSTNGVQFTTHPTPILTHQGGWERNNIGTPFLTKSGATWVLYYHGYGARSGSPDDVQVGIATGVNLLNLTRSSANPLIRTQTDTWNTGTIGRRDILFEGGYYYMVAEVSTDAPYDSARWTTELWRSPSLLGPWEACPKGPVLPITSAGFGNDGPCFGRTPDGKLHIYFRHPSGPTARATLTSNSAVISAPWTFEAELGPYHQTGHADGTTWVCSTAADGPGYAVYGPYFTGVAAGWHVATWRLRINSTTEGSPADVVATVDCWNATTGQRLGGIRPIRRKEFVAGGRYQLVQIAFQAQAGHALEWRVHYPDRSGLRIDWVKVR